MITHRSDKLTADQVKALPVGTFIVLHGRDRRGYSTELHCTLVQRGKSKALAYRAIDGTRETKPIRQLDGAVHFYTIGGTGCGL